MGIPRRVPGAVRIPGALWPLNEYAKAKVLAETLERASGKLMDNKKSPGREVGQLDNAGTHLYLALYWAQELAAQDDDADLKAKFAPVAQELEAKQDAILEELNASKGKAIDLGGYYHADQAKVAAAMRPSSTFNAIIASLN